MALHLPIYDKHLLIVDDNATNIILMQAILDEAGFTNMHSASSAIEAYEILKNEPINLILMDIMMPDIDGLEALEAIKSNGKYSLVYYWKPSGRCGNEIRPKNKNGSFDLDFENQKLKLSSNTSNEVWNLIWIDKNSFGVKVLKPKF